MTLQELADKLTEAWSGISEKMEKLAEALRKAFDEVNKKSRNTRGFGEDRQNGTAKRMLPLYL